jgi:hypothetical protein
MPEEKRGIKQGNTISFGSEGITIESGENLEVIAGWMVYFLKNYKKLMMEMKKNQMLGV